jgi:hypothetical protein
MATGTAGTGNGDGIDAPESVGLPESVVENLLASRRRRMLLDKLDRADGPVSLDALAATIAAREAGVEPDAVSRDRRRETVEEIYQTDLPKLTATAVVEFDSMVGTLELTGAGERLATLAAGQPTAGDSDGA